MKKLYALILSVLLVAVLAVTAFATEDTMVTVAASETTVYRGDEVTLVINMASTDEITAMGYIPFLESEHFEIAGKGKILDAAEPEGITAKFKDFSKKNGMAIGGYENEDEEAVAVVLNGDIAQFKITIKEDAPFGEFTVTDRIAIANGGETVSYDLVEAKITVVCKHEYSDCKKIDEKEHQETCVICGDTRVAEHSWSSGDVTTDPTCKDEGVLTLTCLCGHTGTEVLPKTNEHAYSKWTAAVGGDYTRQCAVCGTEEALLHEVNEEGVTLTGYTGSSVSFEVPSAIGGKPVVAIGANAFADGKLLTELTIPKTVTQIGENAFAKVLYAGSEEQWAQVAGSDAVTGEISFDAQSTIQIMMVPTKITLFRGEEFDIMVYAASDSLYSSLGLIPAFDVAPVAVIKGECLVEDASLGNYSKKDGGVIGGFEEAAVLNGDLFRITLKVNEDAAFGEYTYDAEFKIKNSQEELPFVLSTYNFEVVCNHDYSKFVKVDDQTHSHTCSICGKTETFDHAWDEGKVTVEPNCKDTGIKTTTCTDCGMVTEEILPVTDVHAYGACTKVSDEEHTHTCAVCDKEELLPHDYEEGRCVDCGAYQFWRYIIEEGKVIITKYVGPGGEVEILDKIEELDVIAIAEGAFEGCGDITGISIPKTIKRIAKAFAGCDSLKKVNITDMDAWMAMEFADAECNPLKTAGSLYLNGELVTEVKISGTVADHVFTGCTELKSVIIAEDVEKIGEGTFDGCAGISNVYCQGDSQQMEDLGIKENENLAAADVYCDVGKGKAGNIDGNEEVSDGDALYLLRFTLFPERYPVQAPPDMNNDGVANDGDALYLLRYTLFADRYPLYPGSMLSEIYSKD